MKVVSTYVREQKRYTKNEIQKLLSCDEHEIDKFIMNLKAYNVLKTVKNDKEQREMSDLIDEDLIISNESENNNCLYVFTYVGIIVIGSKVIKVYPKYLLSNKEPLEHMKLIMKVLERYSYSDEQIIKMYNGNGDNRSFNILSIIMYILNDYNEYGIYNNSENIIEINGMGNILWDKTINESFALIENNRPYYLEMYTEKSVDDDMDFFKRLHEAIVTECSEQLKRAKLDSLFMIDSVYLTEDKIEDFGDKDYILDRIYKELNVQFNTRKQNLLKVLYTYIAQDKTILDDNQGISMYGTTAFNLVWESVCAEVLDNKLGTRLLNLELSKPISDKFNKRTKLIDIIEKPKWINDDLEIKANDTLKPDLISVGNSKGMDYFIILDAKYYNLQFEKNKSLRGNPGIGDITKQYLYQLAYKKFIEEHNISLVGNCFLMPTENEEIIDKGIAKLEMLNEMGLQNIQIRLMPSEKMYKLYLNRKRIDIKELNLVDFEMKERNVKEFIYDDREVELSFVAEDIDFVK